MGRMICAICLALVLTAASCALSRQEIDRAVEGTLPPLRSAVLAVQEGRVEDALAALSQAQTLWRAHRFSLQLLLPHSIIQSVEDSLIRCRHAALYGESADFFSEALALSQALSSLSQSQRLTWANLL